MGRDGSTLHEYTTRQERSSCSGAAFWYIMVNFKEKLKGWKHEYGVDWSKLPKADLPEIDPEIAAEITKKVLDEVFPRNPPLSLLLDENLIQCDGTSNPVDFSKPLCDWSNSDNPWASEAHE